MDTTEGLDECLAAEYDRFMLARASWYPRGHCWLIAGRLMQANVLDQVRLDVLELANSELRSGDVDPAGHAPTWMTRQLCSSALRRAWNRSAVREMTGLAAVPRRDEFVRSRRLTGAALRTSPR